MLLQLCFARSLNKNPHLGANLLCNIDAESEEECAAIAWNEDDHDEEMKKRKVVMTEPLRANQHGVRYFVTFAAALHLPHFVTATCNETKNRSMKLDALMFQN